jgi:NAD-dependent deacetylase
MHGPTANLSAAAQALRSGRRIAVLTGAGISAESGVPTFRDAQTGLWARYRPEELATPEAFERDSKMVWEWYQWRRELVGKARPNPAHYALVEIERRSPAFALITQNVDGLHRQAGSRNVFELHGNIHRNKCFEGGHAVERWENDGAVPPRCPHCGGRARPAVVWFGEMLPEAELQQAIAETQHCDLFLCVGTSTVVEPAASLPFAAIEHGATVVEINARPTPLTRCATHVLNGPAGVILPQLVAAAWPTAD